MKEVIFEVMRPLEVELTAELSLTVFDKDSLDADSTISGNVAGSSRFKSAGSRFIPRLARCSWTCCILGLQLGSTTSICLKNVGSIMQPDECVIFRFYESILPYEVMENGEGDIIFWNSIVAIDNCKLGRVFKGMLLIAEEIKQTS